MKLLFCLSCLDVVKLDGRDRACRCGKVCGRYVDEKCVLIQESSGEPPPVVLGVENAAVEEAVAEWSATGQTGAVALFLIRRDASTVERILRITNNASKAGTDEYRQLAEERGQFVIDLQGEQR